MTWILTSTGRKLDFAAPDIEMISIIDITVALSRMPRFAGQTRVNYSVAQHSVLCSRHVPDEVGMQALLHDATEAYMADLPAPLKQLCPDYKRLEQRVWRVIAEAFEVPVEMDPRVKEIDLRMLETERRDLMPFHDEPWPALIGVQPLDIKIESWSEQKAKMMFFERFADLRERAVA